MNQESMNFYRANKEIKAILIMALILAFIFGFNDNKPEFILKNWLLNLIYVFILAFISILFNVLGYKLTAKYTGTEIEAKLWNRDKFKEPFSPKKISSYVLTPILSILITLFSNGRLFFTAVSTFDVKDYNAYGRKFPKATYFNYGLIAVGGLFFNFILMILFKILGLDKGVLINFWFILWNLLPFSNLPGARIFFASRTMWVLTLVFFIANILLVQNLPVISAIVIAFLFSVILAVIYFYFLEYMKA